MDEKKIRLQQLLSCAESWQDEKTPDLAYTLLVTIGWLRRAGIPAASLQSVRQVEINVRRDIVNILNTLDEFMSLSTLPEMAKKMVGKKSVAEYFGNGDDQEPIFTFFLHRDEAELAFSIAKEYKDEERPQNWAIVGKIRRMLDDVDDIILLDKVFVDALLEIGKQDEAEAKYYDPEFFWWLQDRRTKSKTCYLPDRCKDEYVAFYVDEMMLQDEMRARFEKHIASCEDCREQVENLVLYMQKQEI